MVGSGERQDHVVENVVTWSPKIEQDRVPKRRCVQAQRLWCNFSLNLLFITHIPLLYFPSHLKYLIYGFKSILLIFFDPFKATMISEYILTYPKYV